jgi:DNA end-binding protein Ku
MAARSIASLTVSFGLVSIPVRLFSATEASKSISFNMLHKACGSRLKQQYICVKEEVIVPREDTVKGYEFSKDQYVIFTPDELKAMEEAGTHMAEIVEFVPLATGRPGLFRQGLLPRARQGRRQAVRAAHQRAAGIGPLRRGPLGRARQAVHRDDPRVEEGLVMQQLMYSGEVRSISDIDIERSEVKPAELKLAKQLIDAQSSEKFDPDAVPRRSVRAHRGGHREEGRRPGDHHVRRARAPAPR